MRPCIVKTILNGTKTHNESIIKHLAQPGHSTLGKSDDATPINSGRAEAHCIDKPASPMHDKLVAVSSLACEPRQIVKLHCQAIRSGKYDTL